MSQQVNELNVYYYNWTCQIAKLEKFQKSEDEKPV